MSIKLLVDIWNSDLETNKKFVLMVYADFADDKGNNTFPALATIAKKTGLSVSTVRRTVKELVESGLLSFKGVSHLGTSIYSIGGGITLVGGYHHDTQLTDIKSINLKSDTSMTGGGITLEGGIEDDPDEQIGLSADFEKLTGIMAYRLDDWIASCQNMIKNKVTKELLQDAITELRGKSFNITGPWSVEKTAIGIAAARNNLPKGDLLQTDENGRIL
jgi:hypothetical protein